MVSKFALSSAAAVFFGTVATMANAIVIDSFSSVGTKDKGTPWPITQFAVGSVNTVETDLSGVLGGARKTTSTLEGVKVPTVDFMQTSIVPDAGVLLDYASSVGADGALNLLYDGDGSLHADFSQELSILVNFGAFNHAMGLGMPVTITLSDGANSASLTQSLNSAGAGSLTFALARFGDLASVDLSNITSVGIAIDPGAAADFRLVGISTVSIPSPGALALLAVAGVATVRRRR